MIGFSVQKDTLGVIEYKESPSGSGACCEARTRTGFNPTVTTVHSWPQASTVRRDLPVQAVLGPGRHYIRDCSRQYATKINSQLTTRYT